MQKNISFLQKNMDFDTKNNDLFSWLEFFNPEKTITSFAKNNLPDSKLIRKIKWQILDRGGNISSHVDYQNYPFKHDMALISRQITAVNFDKYLHDNQPLPQNIYNFTIDDINWLIHTSTAKDLYAPPMATKRHNQGIEVVLSNEQLSASYLSFSPGIGLSSHNKTTIIPLTDANLEDVLTFLSKHMEKNKNA